MPKDYFKVDQTTALSSVTPGGKIHFIGVAGVAMGQLAVSLAKRGFAVSGSDKAFYEPMGSLLERSAIKLCKGYAAENVPKAVELVVIGNAISYGHPEVAVVEEQGLPYTCFPKLLYEQVISGHQSIVVTGTHGKSTTSAMHAFVLRELGLDPAFFIGGVFEQLPTSLSTGSGRFCVVEGDEYDSAFFAKVPKFAFYKPDICLVNAVEFDHADIYPDLEAVNAEFTKLVLGLPKTAQAICCLDFPNLAILVKAWRASCSARIITFGVHAEADYRITARKQQGLSQRFQFVSKGTGLIEVELNLVGEYNARNALATIVTCLECGLELKPVLAALARFRPVKRRQELRYQNKGLVLVEDFAHHPSAVRETIIAMREAFPGKKLWAVFEPRSNTSRRKVFQSDYLEAFAGADYAVLCKPTATVLDAGIELLDVGQLAELISSASTKAFAFPDANAIAEYLLAEVKGEACVVVMSNGEFGGLIKLLEQGFTERLGVS